MTGHGSPNYAILRRAVLASGANTISSAVDAPAPRAEVPGGVRGARASSDTEMDSTTVAATAVVGTVAVAALFAIAAVLRRRAAAAALPPAEPPAANSADDMPYRSSCSHDAGIPESLTGPEEHAMAKAVV